MGLWCHAKKEASVSMYNEVDKKSKLPPIKTNAAKSRRSANSQSRPPSGYQNKSDNQPKHTVIQDVENQVEGSLVQMLEYQATDLTKRLTKAEMDKQKMELHYNMMKRDFDKINYDLEQFKLHNEDLVEKSHQLDETKR
jgi:hypothetical protein